MLKLEGLGIETKTGLFFGIIGFVLSFVTGFISGISFSVVLIRSLVAVLVFTGIGFAVLMVLKKYVPEIYEVLSASGDSASGYSEETVVHDLEESGSAIYSDKVSGSEKDDAGSSDSGFQELDNQSYERLTSVEDQGLNSELNISEGKMGKHIIMQDQFSEYEPKLIADAVRTMMGKDKE